MSRLNRVLVASFLGILLAIPAPAQTELSWTNSASGLWGSAANWTNGTPAAGGSADYTLVFRNYSTMTATNNAGTPNFALNSLQFGPVAGSATIVGNVGTNLVFTNSTAGVLPQIVNHSIYANTLNIGLVLSTNLAFTGTGLGQVNVNSNVSGVGGITVGGGYSVLLAASNSYYGATLITNGTLKLGHFRALGTNKSVTVSDRGTLDLNNVDLRTNYIYNVTISGAGVGGNGAVVNNAGGGLVNLGLNNLTLAGDATIGGSQRWGVATGVALNGYRLTKTGAPGAKITFNGGEVTAGNIDVNGGILGYESGVVVTGEVGVTTINTGGTLQFYGTASNTIARAVVANGGILSLGEGGAGAGAANAPITLQSNLTILGAGDYTLNGAISDSGGSFGFTKTGANALNLTAINSYSGNTYLYGGLVQFVTAGSMGGFGQSVYMSNGAAAFQYASAIDVATQRFASIQLGTLAMTTNDRGADVDFSAAFFTNTYLGAVTGTVITNGTITPNGTTWRLGGGGGVLVVTQQISGANDLYVGGFGKGRAVLSASNDYTGVTRVDYGGVLVLTNSGALLNSSSLMITNTSSIQLTGQNLTMPITVGGAGSQLDGINGATIDVIAGTNVISGPITVTAGSSLKNNIGANMLTTISGGITSINNAGFDLYGDNGTIILTNNPINLGTGTMNGKSLVIAVGGNVAGQMNSSWGGLITLAVDNAFTNAPIVYIGLGANSRLDLNGHSMVVSGLMTTNAAAQSANQVTNSSGTAATLTVSNFNVSTFGGAIGGASMSLVKAGTGTLVLIGTNSLGGTTTVNGGSLTVMPAFSYTNSPVTVNTGSLMLGNTNAFGAATITLAGTAASIGPAYAIDQNFLNWATNKLGGVPSAFALGATSANALDFSPASYASTFLGAGATSTVVYSGGVNWGGASVRLGGGAGTLLYSVGIGAGSNLVVGPVGGNRASTVILTNSNPGFNGAVTVNSGSLNVQRGDTLGTNVIITVNDGGALQVQGTFALATNALFLSGMGANNDGALRMISGVATNQGGITLNSDSRINGELAGQFLMTGALTNKGFQLYLGGAGTNTAIVGPVSGLGGVIKDGTGIAYLGGTNTYAGVTTISGGVLRVLHIAGGVTSLGTNNLVMSNGVLEINNVPNNLSFIRALGTGSNQVQITGGASGFSAYGNNTEVRLNNSTAYTLVWGTNLFSPSTLVLNAPSAGKQLTFNNILDLNGTNRAIDVYGVIGNGNSFAILNQAVSNTAGTAAGIIKGGPGVLQMAASSYYNGPTIVTGGVLMLSLVTSLPAGSNLVLSNGVMQAAYGDMTLSRGTGGRQITLPDNVMFGFSSYNGLRTVKIDGNTNMLTWGGGFNPSALVLGEYSANHNLIFANGLDLNGTNRTMGLGGYNTIIGNIVTNSGATPAGLVLARTQYGTAGTLLVLGDNFRYDGTTIVSNGATLQVGDYWNNNGQLPSLAGNASSVSNLGTVVVANFSNATWSGNMSGVGGVLTKNSRSTLVMTGTNTYTGRTTVNNGTLTLDFAAPAAPGTNILSASAPMTLGGLGVGGGVLRIRGADGVTNAQTIAGFTSAVGANSIVFSNGAGGVVNLALGAVARNAGSTLDLSLPAGGILSTTTAWTFGLLNGSTTIDGANWATVNANGVIGAYSDYTTVSGGTIANASNTNVRLSGSASIGAGTSTINTMLATNDGVARTVTLGAGNTLRMGPVGGILMPSGSGDLTIGATPNDGMLTAGGGAINVAGELVFINNSASLLTVNSVLTNNGTGALTVTKAGSGAAVFEGNNYYTGASYINGGSATFDGTNLFGGAMTVAGGSSLTFSPSSSNIFVGQLSVNNGSLTVNGPITTTNNANIVIGNTVASRAVAYVSTNITIGGTGRLLIGTSGDNNRSASALFQTGGVVSMGNAGNAVTLADGINNYGYYGMSGGVITNADVIGAYRGIAIMDVSGSASVYPTNTITFANDRGAIGQLNVFGGLVNAPATSGGILKLNGTGYSSSFGMINMLGGTVNASYGAAGKVFEMMGAVSNFSMVNLNAGTLIANKVQSGNAGFAVFNFNGGTLQAPTGTTVGATFMTGLAAAYVYEGGANIDSGTNVITIGQSLLMPTSYGLASMATNASCGGQYIAQPYVQIAGGSGTGATAIAQMDYGTGTITNFLVTSAGTGYQPGDVLTVSLLGGGPLSTPTTFTVSGASLAPTTGGGLNKYGTGTLILSGANSFSGDTRVYSGVLSLFAGNSLSNSILDYNNYGGTVTFNTNSSTFTVGGLSGAQDLALLTVSNAAVNLFVGSKGASTTYGGVLSGSGSLVKMGSGTLTLTNGNTYSGGTTVSNGVLTVANLVGTGTGTGTLTVVNSGVLNLAGGTISNRAGNTTIGGGTGSATLNISAGELVLGSGANNPFFYIGNGTGAGLVNMTGGRLTSQYSSGSDPWGSQIVIGNGATGNFIVSGPATTALVQQVSVGGSAPGFMVISNGAFVTQDHNVRFMVGNSAGVAGSVTVDGGTLVVQASPFRFGNTRSTGFLTITNDGLVVAKAGVQLGMLAGAAPTYSYEGTGIVFQSSGTFSNYNQYLYLGAMTNAVGAFNMSGGLYAGGNGAVLLGQFQGAKGTLNVSGGTFDSAAGVMTIANSTGSVGVLNLTGGKVMANQIAMVGAASTAADATLLMSGGELLVGAGGITANSTPGSSATVLLSGGTVGSLGNWSSAVNMVLTNAPGGGVVTFAPTNTVALSGVLSGNGSLVKSGSGLLRLSASNTYSGTTRVMAGVVELTGAGALGGTTTLQIDSSAKVVATNVTATTRLLAGQTLKGSGTFQGGLIAESASVVAPGDSPGMLTIDGSLQMESGSIFDVELNGLTAGTQYDQLVFNNNGLTLNNPTLNVTLGFLPVYSNQFTIVAGLGTTAAGQFNGLPDGGQLTTSYGATPVTLQIKYNSTGSGDPNNDITLTVVPEPTAVGLFGLGLAAALLRRRRVSR